MAIGSFALVGLKATSPDMRLTSQHYFDTYNLADIQMTSTLGMTDRDEKIASSISGVKNVEFGYFTDVTVGTSITPIRVFSAPDKISRYEVVSGRLPQSGSTTEIAVTNQLSDDYKLGDTITLKESSSTESTSGNSEDTESDVLSEHTFTIVGFVNSVEMISTLNMGQSTAGTGTLEGYAVVDPQVFTTDYYMIARFTFDDLQSLDPYSTTYTSRLTAHRDALTAAYKNRPDERLSEVKAEAQKKIDDAQAQVDESKQKLADGQTQLDDAQKQIDEAQAQIDAQSAQATDAQNTINQSQAQLNEAAQTLNSSADSLNDFGNQLATAKAQLDSAYTQLQTQAETLNAARIQLIDAQNRINAGRQQIEQARSMGVPEEQLVAQEQALNASQSQVNEQRATYDAGLSQYNAALEAYNSGVANYQARYAQWSQAVDEYNAGKSTYDSNAQALDQARSDLQSGNAQIADAQAQLDEKKQELAQNKADYDSQLADSQQKIADAEADIAQSQEKLDAMTSSAYSIDSRREWLGSEGYIVYSSSPQTIESLSNIFALFLYFVAAMVTITTMSRFVDEERTNAGAMKALGYSNFAVILKFLVYGSASSLLGAVIGILFGLYFMPTVVYTSLVSSFTMPSIELHFYFGISAITALVSLACATVPTLFVAIKELHEKPAALLLPKPPVAGASILLERVRFIWNRLSFTYKVTIRNIFRYKDRMFMTVFGVAGATALLFAGLGLQASINGTSSRQTDTLVTYDLIVAKNSYTTAEDDQKLEDMLDSSSVSSSKAVHFETTSITAGKNEEKNTISVIVPENNTNFDQYVTLYSRSAKSVLNLTDEGAVITERMAELKHLKVGDSLTVQDDNGIDRTVKIAGIAEMYMGHSLYMTPAYYAKIFGKAYTTNAYLVNLKDRSSNSIQQVSADFIQLSAVASVIQNIALTRQIDVIADSLNMVMLVLVFVAILLALIILYNLTNINVSERIRELSTIKVLGFFDKEVTLYIYRETIILSIAGIALGFGLGAALHLYMLEVVPPNLVMFNPDPGYLPYVVPIVVIIATLWGLSLYVHRRMRTVDMLEALKSVE
ncbi:FtsX-like permease family protein [Alloscardovia criceti]|uniref:FtsX-like permease family protein n=1 Tax=Alloscardovia criceti TaxID=356828 RepID=UPI0003783548|nr:FtsX-like permease family protein [Alloscardovia criceti]